MDASQRLDDAFERASQLDDLGLWRQAWHALGAPSLDQMGAERDPDRLLLLASIVANLGHAATGRRLQIRARRLHPRHERARQIWANQILDGRGPLAFLQRFQTAPDTTFWLMRRCEALAQLHDFEAAEHCFAGLPESIRDGGIGQRLLGEIDWMADRRDEAVARLEALLAADPSAYRTRMLLLGWYRERQDQQRFAQMLLDTDAATECLYPASLGLQQAVQCEDATAVAHWVARIRALALPPAQRIETWLTTEQARLLLRLGQPDQARTVLERACDLPPFWEERLRRLRLAAPDAPRSRLPVKVIRQRFMTCAPATIASLLDYFGAPTAEPEVAAAICFGGTYDRHQRRYLRQRGFVIREFRMTAESAQALLAAGVPFALSMHEFDSGHLLAVIGYDASTDLYRLRDPGRDVDTEVASDYFQFGQMANGPKAFAFVPAARAADLDAIALPESDAYATVGEFEEALDLEQADRARAALETLRGLPDATRLYWLTEWQMASFDQDRQRALRSIDALLEHFPEDAWLHWMRLSASTGLESHAERERAMKTATLHSAHPNFLISLARFYFGDARQWALAGQLLNRASKKRPISATLFSALADWSELQGDPAAASFQARLASLQSPSSESLAQRYFDLAREHGDLTPALSWLAKRDQDGRSLTREPALTRYRCLLQAQHDDDALALLTELERDFADDPKVQFEVIERDRNTLPLADVQHRLQAWPEHPTAIRQLAQAYEAAGDSAAALKLLEARLSVEPLAIDLHYWIARLIADRNGDEAVQRFVLDAYHAAPHQIERLNLCLSYLVERRPEVVIRLLEGAMTQHPNNAWLARQLGFLYLECGRLPDAQRVAERARELQPNAAACFNLLGALAAAAQQKDEALAFWWQSITKGGAQGYALSQSFEFLDDAGRGDLLQRQAAILGRCAEDEEALLDWAREAPEYLDQETCLNAWDALAARFGHAWQWHVGRIQMLHRFDAAAALTAATAFTEQRSRLPIAWLTRAKVERNVDVEAALHTTRHLLTLAPNWADALTLLGTILAGSGQLGAAAAELRAACARSPRHVPLLCRTAQVLMDLGETREAQRLLERVLQLDDSQTWAWERLEELSPAAAETQAVHWTQRRPGIVASWYRLAYICVDRNPERALIACNEALRRRADHLDSISLKSMALASLSRIDEALGCLDQFDPDGQHASLCWRRAWVLWAGHRRGEATKVLQQALQRFPDNFALLSLNADYCREPGLHERARDSLNAMRRLAPKHAPTVLRLAWLECRRGMTPAAEAAFRQAVELDPSLVDAWVALIQHALDQKQLTEAFALYHRAREHSQCSDLRLANVELQIYGNASAEIDRAMSAALADASITEEQVDALHRRIAPRWIEVLTRLNRLLVDPVPCAAFSSALVATRYSDCYRALPRILQRLETGATDHSDRGLITALLNHWAKDQNNGPFVASLFYEHQDLFKTDPVLRDDLCYALTELNRPAEVCALLQSWRERPPLPGSVSFNYATSLARRGQFADSLDVRRAAIYNRQGLGGAHAAYACLDAILCADPVETTWRNMAAVARQNLSHKFSQNHAYFALNMLAAVEQPSPWRAVCQLVKVRPTNDLAKTYQRALRRHVLRQMALPKRMLAWVWTII
ncbi:hypothetical protein C7S18_03305 [Ahniella affigens]|uniref:Peptidase C39-like domain-containing protein n=1 Tax=Ahniella affigens TaxID=2021234 RepID=A0A2P1PN71_9GAMM|nr:tetratricopeptide repeat protein [Ahniella affigens]AVP96275.1 hypothetical protein C7S18_03305 [Ahniella affigens]